MTSIDTHRTHYTDLDNQLGEALDDLAAVVGNPHDEATELNRIAAITRVKAALSHQVNAVDRAKVNADRDAAAVAALVADLTQAYATDQPRTTQIPELEDDANAVAAMNALSSTDPAVATYSRVASLNALAEVLTQHGINADTVTAIAAAYQRAGDVDHVRYGETPPVAALVLVSAFILVLAAASVVGIFRTGEDPGQALGLVIAAGLTGYLVKVLLDMLGERHHQLEGSVDCDQYVDCPGGTDV